MDGLLVVNKPTGKTSRDVVNSLNDFFEMKKIGHAGTLDPIAEGVLIVTMGKCTKLNDLFTNHDKEYLTTMKLGLRTDTFDISGKILSEDYVNFTEEEIINAVIGFKGIYNQEVPKYSAVKVNGKKLYEYARNNENVVLPKREVNIKKIEIISIEKNNITFKCLVSKGTYIRSLINDIGNKLGCGAIMTKLIRLSQGEYTLDNSYTLEEIYNNKYKIISIEELFKKYKKEEVKSNKLKQVKNGALVDKNFTEEYILYYEKNNLIAIYKTYEKDNTKAKPLLII